MQISEIEAKTLLRKSKKVDSWFLSTYSLNLYRGCQHGCGYCDGMAEDYYVKEDFHKYISVKRNAPEILQAELFKIRKSGLSPKGVIVAGGGVSDSYQPVESKYKITRKSLKIIADNNFPVHIITKSNLVNRDSDIIQEINKKRGAVVSMSFSTVDDKISSILEPFATKPTKRLETLRNFKLNGIKTGLLLLPVVPFLTDTESMIDAVFKKASDNGVDFLLFGGMTLKAGRQKQNFYDVVNKFYPEVKANIDKIYRNDKYGNPAYQYQQLIHNRMLHSALKHKIQLRLPYDTFEDTFTGKQKLCLIFEHLHYIFSLHGIKTNFGKAAIQMSKINDALNEFTLLLHSDKFDRTSTAIINEFLKTGKVSLYESVIHDHSMVTKEINYN